MRLNDLSPAVGSKKSRTRVGRGIGSGLGKTAGRGHKGQHARAGGLRKIGFEGGQMPLQRRLPRSGFVSHVKPTRAEVRLGALDRLETDKIDLAALVEAGLVPAGTERVKIILAGELKRAVTVVGPEVVATRGARAAIEKAGGKAEAPGGKAAPKPRVAKQAPEKKAPAKEASATEAPVTEAPAKKKAATKATAKKAATKKATTKKATAKKTTAKKASAKKKTTAKKASAKKTGSKARSRSKSKD